MHLSQSTEDLSELQLEAMHNSDANDCWKKVLMSAHKGKKKQDESKIAFSKLTCGHSSIEMANHLFTFKTALILSFKIIHSAHL